MKSTKRLGLVILAVVLTMVLVPTVASAASGYYNTGDIAVINTMVDNNGLKWTKAPADGSSIPEGWYVTWSSSVTNKRIIELDLL